MSRTGLKNFVRRETVQNGQDSWRLEMLDGSPVPAFSSFCGSISDLAASSRKRYAEVVSRFLDYLYECGALDQPISARRLNVIIDVYPILLRDGCGEVAKRIEQRFTESCEMLSGSPDEDDEAWLAQVARELDWDAIQPSSFANTLAAVNRFLRLSESLAREAAERQTVLFGGETDFAPLIEALRRTDERRWREVVAMKQNSLLGSVAKFAPSGIRRPKRLRNRKARPQEENLDFPLDQIPRLIQAATSWRDKALWLLLGASGIRLSEARNLLLEDVDLVQQRVYVYDPRGRRYKLESTDEIRYRFKGREVAHTYLFSPLREQFFETLEKYLRHEFIPKSKPGEPQYLFQYIDPARRGMPLVDASDSALAKSFRRAVVAAAIPHLMRRRRWTIHSLRHLYGVYMLNDFPVDPKKGTYGLDLVEVQMLMGHAKISATALYARGKHRRLVEKLAASDATILGLMPAEAALLPGAIQNRLGLLA